MNKKTLVCVDLPENEYVRVSYDGCTTVAGNFGSVEKVLNIRRIHLLLYRHKLYLSKEQSKYVLIFCKQLQPEDEVS